MKIDIAVPIYTSNLEKGKITYEIKIKILTVENKMKTNILTTREQDQDQDFSRNFKIENKTLKTSISR